MAAKENKKTDSLETIKRLTSGVCVICIFLVVICGIKANVSVYAMSLRAIVILLAIKLATFIIVKTVSAWDFAKEKPQAINSANKK